MEKKLVLPSSKYSKPSGLIGRLWTWRIRTAGSDTPYRCCFVNWEVQRTVLRLNTELQGEELVTGLLSCCVSLLVVWSIYESVSE